MATLRQAVRIGCVNVIVVLLLFALIEGVASLLFITNDLLRQPGVDEHRHAEHDETLGWVNRPNVYLPDMYGPGVYLRTNSQGFRNDHDFSVAVPSGKVRIICSGDSFTLAYGVSNDQTWCQRLVGLDTKIETVNMGQGGYGLDQAYLWYMRDGVKLDHHVQLLSFITYDFERMRSARFMGYGKPVLQVRNDSLVVANYPVPKTSAFAPWWVLNAPTFGRLNSVRLLRRVLRMDRTVPDSKLVGAERERIRALASRIFANLERVNTAKGSRLVLVYMPTAVDYHGNNTQADETDSWRSFVQAEADRQNIPFIDLVGQMRPLPPLEGERLFAENGHFSVEGNAYVAAVLHERLEALQQSRSRPSR